MGMHLFSWRTWFCVVLWGYVEVESRIGGYDHLYDVFSSFVFPNFPFLISETLRRMALMRGLSPIRLLEVNAARVCIFVLLQAIEVFGSASSLAKETILFNNTMFYT